MKKLQQYYRGKLCTIMTRSSTQHYDETQHANLFVGIVEDVDEYGVWLLQLNTKKKSFFFAHNLIGIIEESVTAVNDDEARYIKNELEKRAATSHADLVQLDKVKALKKIANKEQQK